MVRVYLIAYNRPDLLPLQVEALQRHLTEPHEIIVINNGQEPLARQLKRTARSLGLRVHRVRQPNHATANYSHARAVEFAYQRFVSRDTDISLIVEHDVFPFRRFSPRELLAGAAMAGVPQSRAGAEGQAVHYLHPGLLVLDLPALPEPESLSFWPDRVDGVECDVGGHIWEYWRRHPDLRVCHLVQTSIESSNGAGQWMAAVGGSFVHYVGASNWANEPAAWHSDKTQWLRDMLRAGLTGPLRESATDTAGFVVTAGSLFR